MQGKLFHKSYDEVLIFGNFGEFLTFGNFVEFFYSGRKGGEAYSFQNCAQFESQGKVHLPIIVDEDSFLDTCEKAVP